ncbi:dihydrofolate reductase family protein [Deinococcus multiflagellatus]|uniref:Dihydrofolate reductase family protein n=1 Tax=Deinococcus multiflagellatus TaxID=1656887 RepID=A0ABW1ZMI8_9DEIO|nr:dihydrofolate reductase family protein [Deinococcus multiflagellatus]MBZ9714171.1 dihydrofolate reductase family protein [Deinococcus multiflagellatus]
MSAFHVFVATSLDGFIARADGRLDWLPGASPDGLPAPEGEDYGFDAFMADIDVVVMGRVTFETVQALEPWPYAGRRMVVLSRTLPEQAIPAPRRADVTVHPGPLPALVDDLRAQGVRGVYVDGGQTVQAFLRAGLIDRLIITRVPVLLGRGLPLFGDLPEDLWWDHLETRPFPSGLVQSHYRLRR